MTFDVKAAVAAAVQYTPNMNEATAGGGGDYTPPAEGTAQARFVGYFETGIHEEEVSTPQGKVKKERPQVELLFELFGPKHPPVGTPPVPQRLTVRCAYSLNEKAGFYKIFRRMNYKGTATHIAQLLGEAFLLDISHSTNGKEGAEKRTWANARPKGGEYTIRAPRYQDPISGDTVEVPVPAAVGPIRAFLWDAPQGLKEMWDSIFIDGNYPDRKAADGSTTPGGSKNVIQNKIKSALNFKGSELEALLAAGTGKPLDLGNAETAAPPATPPANAAAADPLAAV